jgi:multidrug efflux pump
VTLSHLSVRRPVLAAVANLLIVVFGIAALQTLPIRELPDVDTAVVTVTTTYRGAAPEVVDTDITEIVEGAVASISGIRSISSESRQGRSRTTSPAATSTLPPTMCVTRSAGSGATCRSRRTSRR